ncbi:capsule biosynthesis GfcC family protein [Halomonas sp. KM007]
MISVFSHDHAPFFTRFASIARSALAGALLIVYASPAPAAATVPPAPTLADAWLETLPTLAAPVNWSYAFGLLKSDTERLTQSRHYLIEELNTLAVSARVAGNERNEATLRAWQTALARLDGQPLRSPQRMDLLAFGATLRQAPLLSNVAYWGACEPPAWIEVWGREGVMRPPWQPGSSLKSLMAHRASGTFEGVDAIHVITPQGRVLRRGVAAWNAQPTPLAPGSRVVIELPNRQGLSGALPFPGTTHELDIVNQRLPHVLAAQLPGEQCNQWQAP